MKTRNPDEGPRRVELKVKARALTERIPFIVVSEGIRGLGLPIGKKKSLPVQKERRRIGFCVRGWPPYKRCSDGRVPSKVPDGVN